MNKNRMIVKYLEVVKREEEEMIEVRDVMNKEDDRWLMSFKEEHCKVDLIDYDEGNILEGMSW